MCTHWESVNGNNGDMSKSQGLSGCRVCVCVCVCVCSLKLHWRLNDNIDFCMRTHWETVNGNNGDLSRSQGLSGACHVCVVCVFAKAVLVTKFVCFIA